MKSIFYSMLFASLMVFTKPAMAEEEAKTAPNFTVAKETTYITEPLTKDGYPDYPRALNNLLSRGVTAENNANVLFWQAHGPHPERATMPAEFFELLGMESPPDHGEYFTNLQDYLTSHRVAPDRTGPFFEQQTSAMAKPWKVGDYPEIAAWLQANEKPLALVAEGAKRAKYFSPLVITEEDGKMNGLISVLLPAVQSSRSFSRALVARAMLNIGEGKTDEAWQDLLTCHRLGRLIGQGSTLIEGLVGIAIEGVALHGELVFLEQAIPMRNEITNYQRDLNALPPLLDMADKVDVSERFMFLDSTFLIARGGDKIFAAIAGEWAGGGMFANGLFKKFLERGIDYNVVLKMGNEWFDRLDAAMREPTHPKRMKAIQQINIDLQEIAAKAQDPLQLAKLLLAKDLDQKTGRIFGAAMLAMLIPSAEAVQSAEDRIVQQNWNLQLALALAAYQADHDGYPPKLDELSPQYMAKVPDDLFTEKPLVYRVTDEGYLLYSFGMNGQDDGGNYYDDEPRGDDIRVRVPSQNK